MLSGARASARNILSGCSIPSPFDGEGWDGGERGGVGHGVSLMQDETEELSVGTTYPIPSNL